MKEVLKNKKTLMIIIAALVLVVGIVLAIVIINSKGEKENNKDNTHNVKEEIKETEEEKTEEQTEPSQAPASSAEELKDEVKNIVPSKITSDKIVFSETLEVKEGEKVAIWVYSKPKFLGYFEIKLINGEKVIEGLEEKIANLKVERGKHNIAIVTEEGSPVGYVDIFIKDDGKIEEEVIAEKEEEKETDKEESNEKEETEQVKTTTKKEIKKETIKFTTETRKNSNLAKGESKTIQEGKAGEKEITYEVTYNAEGKEISRKKLSEKVTKEATKKIVETGTADFNLNTAQVQGSTMGFMCTEKDPEYGGCADGENVPEFNAIGINGTYYAKCSSHSTACASLGIKTSIKLTTSGEGYTGNVNGKTYYFDPRAGDGGPGEPLTITQCNDYKLTCGTW